MEERKRRQKKGNGGKEDNEVNGLYLDFLQSLGEDRKKLTQTAMTISIMTGQK